MPVSENPQRTLDARVAALAVKCPATCYSADVLSRYYQFLIDSEQDPDEYSERVGYWESYRGKRMLDIGGGLSDWTAELLLLGANACSLDYNYGQRLQALLRRADTSGHEVSQRFLDSIQGNPQRYIQGSATKLPFRANVFDGITSHYGIFGVMDKNMDLLRMSGNEAIRVLKPEVGIFQFGPFGGATTDRQIDNQVRFFDELSERGDIELTEVRDPVIRLFGFSFAGPEDEGLLQIRKLVPAA